MQELKLLSNGFFSKKLSNKDDITQYKNYIGIDYYEEAEFDEFDNEDTFNLICDDYTFNINDLRDLKAEKGENILKEFIISEKSYEQLAVNYYISYSKRNDELKVIINIYDFEDINEKLLEQLNKFGRSIEIIINTEEEKKIFLDMLNAYFIYKGYKNLEDFLIKEYYNFN